MRELVAIEPFCGAGGIALGLGDAGFAHAWAGELDKHAATTFRSMFPGVPVFNGKVETGREADDAVAGREIDLLAGGVPCQPFSTAGRGQGEYDSRDGFPAFLRMTRHLRPRAFLIENVKGLTTRKHAAYFARVLADLRAAGYAVGWRVLDAADYGMVAKCPLHASASQTFDAEFAKLSLLVATGPACVVAPAMTQSEGNLIQDAWVVAESWGKAISADIAGRATRVVSESVSAELPERVTPSGLGASSWMRAAIDVFGADGSIAESIAKSWKGCWDALYAQRKLSTTSMEIPETMIRRILKSIKTMDTTGERTGLALRRGACGLCADWAVPQRRHRVFIVGLRRDVAEAGRSVGIRFTWPAPTHSIEALVAAKWVNGTYWQEHGFDGPPKYATQSKEEARVLKRLQALDAEATARVELARWRTVRDAIGDIAGHALPDRTMHSAPVEVESATVALTTTTGDRRVSASGRQSASDLPSDAVQSAHAGHNGHPPVVGLVDVGHDGERKGGTRARSVLYKPTLPDMPVRTVAAAAEQQGSEHAMRVAVANHEPPAPVKASETRPEWLAKHPAAAADAPSPAVRTGHRDAGTLVVDAAELANHGPAPLSPLVQGRIDTGEVDVTLRKHPIRKLDTVSPAVESNLARGGYYGLVELDGLTVRNIGAGDGDGKRVDEPGPAVPAGSDGQRGLGVFDPSSRHAWTGGEGTTEPGRIHSRPAVMLRRLTVRECARLQDFPDSHVFSGPKTAAYRQVGNAAPRGLVRPVALAIAAFLRAVDESDVADLE